MNDKWNKNGLTLQTTIEYVCSNYIDNVETKFKKLKNRFEKEIDTDLYYDIKNEREFEKENLKQYIIHIAEIDKLLNQIEINLNKCKDNHY